MVRVKVGFIGKVAGLFPVQDNGGFPVTAVCRLWVELSGSVVRLAESKGKQPGSVSMVCAWQ